MYLAIGRACAGAIMSKNRQRWQNGISAWSHIMFMSVNSTVVTLMRMRGFADSLQLQIAT